MENLFQVETIDIRDRIHVEVINRISQQIAERFKPQKIILFGSYAYGIPTPESDIDLLVIMETSLKEIQQAQQIRQFLNPLFGIDLLVHTKENLEKRLKMGDLFLQEVVSKGKVLYECIDA
jgi:uncharacterized protein